jgi:hypothetical protein
MDNVKIAVNHKYTSKVYDALLKATGRKVMIKYEFNKTSYIIPKGIFTSRKAICEALISEVEQKINFGMLPSNCLDNNYYADRDYPIFTVS